MDDIISGFELVFAHMYPELWADSAFLNKGRFADLITHSDFYIESGYLNNVVWMLPQHCSINFAACNDQVIHMDWTSANAIFV